jgi:hypothetical protein
MKSTTSLREKQSVNGMNNIGRASYYGERTVEITPTAEHKGNGLKKTVNRESKL